MDRKKETITVALVPCAECGNSVSTLAATCPKCGAPLGTDDVGGAALPRKQVTATPSASEKGNGDSRVSAAWVAPVMVLIVLIVIVAGILGNVIVAGKGRQTGGSSP